jgi:hypothetical protein
VPLRLGQRRGACVGALEIVLRQEQKQPAAGGRRRRRRRRRRTRRRSTLKMSCIASIVDDTRRVVRSQAMQEMQSMRW